MSNAVVNACTIVAQNYLPHARVLAASYLEHHPEGSFTVLVIDAVDTTAVESETFTVWTPYDLNLERAEVHRMAFIYDVKEFATALKPWLLKRMLEDAEHAVYFDPDIEVFASLSDIGQLAGEHGIVLTPHTTRPLPRDDLLPNDEMLLRAGIYNLGFISVSRKATSFLDWWADRLRRYCLVDTENGLFVDQRWVDFVPALFEHTILRDTTCNVAYWNLEQRTLKRTGERYEVDGAPLRFFHYSGFDPDDDDRLSAHMGTIPRVLLRDHPDLRQLCDRYGRRLREHGYGNAPLQVYRFNELPGGLAIDSTSRRDVREAIVTAERAGQCAPDPFDPTTMESFLTWLAEPADADSPLPRYLAAMYRRDGGLRHAFPEAASSNPESFVDWACGTKETRPDVPRAVLSRICGDRPAPPPVGLARRLVRRYPWLSPLARGYRAARTLRSGLRARGGHVDVVSVSIFPPLPGVNVVGYLDAELGVGEAARRVIAGLDAGTVPHATVTYGRTPSRRDHPFQSDRATVLYDTNLICVNADQLPYLRADLPHELFERGYNIGLWFWEVSTFPRTLHNAFDLVDEIWVASDFTARALAPHTDKPVHVIPLPVETPHDQGITRTELGLCEGFLFLFSFDFMSVVERKNPSGLIDAFTRAFAPNEGPILVIKTINGAKHESRLARLRREATGRSDILLIDGYLSAAENRALTATCDCYVSLHRSEGYGLTIAEAMVNGKPVISTGYSGNMTFMDDANSFVVPHVLVPIPHGCDPYPIGAEWASPDLEAAAELMRRVWEEPDVASAMGRRARDDISRRFPASRTAAFVAQRLNELRPARACRADRSAAVRGFATGGSRIHPTAIARRSLARLLDPYVAEQQELAALLATQLRSHPFEDHTAVGVTSGHRGRRGHSEDAGAKRAA